MKINFSPIKFKGYDATPIKNLYMQGVPYENTYGIFNELKKIGKKENFDVFIHSEAKMFDSLKDVGMDEYEDDIWAQDNKILRPEAGGTKVLSPKLRVMESVLPIQFANLTHNKLDVTETVFEGGNLFIGKKDNGEEYILTGSKNLMVSSMMAFLNAKCVKEINRELLQEFSHYGKITTEENGDGDWVYIKEWEDNQEIYNKIAIDTMAEEFGVKKENIFIIHQPNFHIDMNIRPIGYPYVLVNDPNLAIENLEHVPLGKGIAEITENREEYRKKEYCEVETTIKELESYGFKPIRIGGVYASGEVNFLNAVVNKHEDGTISYITNSSNCNKAGYSKLEKIFEKELKSKVPNLKKVYFVRGEKVGDKKLNIGNAMMESLLRANGGVHCMTLEEPDFSKY